MITYRPVPLMGAPQVPFHPPAGLARLGQGAAATTPLFGLPLVTSGIIMTVGGLVSGALGVYLAVKGATVIGKKVPTFWAWYFGTGGIGVTMALLGAVPLVALGVTALAGGVIIQKKMEEASSSFVLPRQQ